MVRLARLVLLDRSRHSADPRVRREALAFLRERLPRDVSKVAESLNVAAYNLHHRFRDQGDAAVVYQRAIAADPEFSWPYANLGRLYMDMDEAELGLEWLEAATRLDPNHFRAWVNLGLSLYSLRRYEEAVPAYQAALALNPNDAFVHAYLGRSLLSLGRDGEGVREFRPRSGSTRASPRSETSSAGASPPIRAPSNRTDLAVWWGAHAPRSRGRPRPPGRSTAPSPSPSSRSPWPTGSGTRTASSSSPSSVSSAGAARCSRARSPSSRS